MAAADEREESDDLTEEEYRVLAAHFRSTTLGSLPDVMKAEHLQILNTLLALTRDAFIQANALRDAGKGRAAAIHALRATWMFFAGFRTFLKEGLYAPLYDVLDAVRALDDGLVMPLLTPERPSGRSPDTVARRGFADVVALIVNMLVWHGFRAIEARKLVARRLR